MAKISKMGLSCATAALVAAMVALLFSDDGEWINGQVVSVDGGVTMRA